MEKTKAFGICLYKKRNNTIEILLCKSIKSQNRWGFLKGVALKNETAEDTAVREFFEESGIKVTVKLLNKFFIQKNKVKDIGIFLVDFDHINGVEKYFNEDKLHKHNLSDENSSVKFFKINDLPLIKKKQKYLVKDIVKYFNIYPS